MAMANSALVFSLLVLLVVIPTTTAVYAQTTNSTNNTLSSNPNAVQARITELEQQDPAFAYYRNSIDDCLDTAFSSFNNTVAEMATLPSARECSLTFQTAFNDWCSAASPAFNAEKCDIVKNDMETYDVIESSSNLLSDMEYFDGSPYFAPDGTVNEPPSVFPPPVLPPAGGNEVFEPQPPPRLPQAYKVVIDPDFASAPPNAEVRLSPLKIQVGDTVTWLNEDQDREEHTVTSGQNGQPDGKFNSGPIQSSLGTTSTPKFEHTFTEAGEYPYFCILHPNMVGTVSVAG